MEENTNIPEAIVDTKIPAEVASMISESKEHIHSENCGCSSSSETSQSSSKPSPQPAYRPVDARKEQKNLKYNNYAKLAPTFPYKYTIANNNKQLIVEVCATSPVHACTLLGWRAKNCKVLEVRSNKEITPIELPPMPAQVTQPVQPTQDVVELIEKPIETNQ